MTLVEAIATVEANYTFLTQATAAAGAADEKFQAAQQAKSSADLTKGSAAFAFNASLDELITAATAAKIV